MNQDMLINVVGGFFALTISIILLWYFVFYRNKKAQKIEPIQQNTPTVIAPKTAATSEETITTAAVGTAEKYPEETAPAKVTPETPEVFVDAWALGLKKSRDSIWTKLSDAFKSVSGQEVWNEKHPLWEHLEESLLAADLGPKITELLLLDLKSKFAKAPELETLKAELKKSMLDLLERTPSKVIDTKTKPHVTLLIGVNGAGKTTTAGKLAYKAKQNGENVILGAADTFRAAAVDQLQVWADRLGIECVVPAHGANPAAVAFDAAASAVSKGVDQVIIDTAGRLHTKDNLMEELKKIGRVLDKKIPGSPHSVYLVLDASLGQNAIFQAREFSQAIPATGVILTKLDGSSKGGAALSVSTELGIPIAFVGLGEKSEDLKPFNAKDFVDNLFPN